MQVRRAEPTDLSELIRLCIDHAKFEGSATRILEFSDRLGDRLFGASTDIAVWVAVSDAMIVGYATASPAFSTWHATDYLHIDCLYLDSAHRGQGGGKLLISAICGYARANKFPWLEWQTPTWNARAIRFYERFGATCSEKARFSMTVAGQPDVTTQCE